MTRQQSNQTKSNNTKAHNKQQTQTCFKYLDSTILRHSASSLAILHLFSLFFSTKYSLHSSLTATSSHSHYCQHQSVQSVDSRHTQSSPLSPLHSTSPFPTTLLPKSSIPSYVPI